MIHKTTDLLPTTLVGLNTAFGWPEGTAEAILIERAPAPPLPVGARQPVAAGGIPRRLQAELEGKEIEVRVIHLDGNPTKFLLVMATDPDADLADIRDAASQFDDLERKFHASE